MKIVILNPSIDSKHMSSARQWEIDRYADIKLTLHLQNGAGMVTFLVALV